MKTLVTGGSGFLGKRLKIYHPEWIYVSTADYCLTDSVETMQMFEEIRPNAVIHLAARVGGIKDNSENQVDFFEQNMLINLNVIKAAYDFGVDRLLASLSTCAFPDVVAEYPFKEKDLLEGPPAETNFAYGFTKRMLHTLILSYRKQYGVNYSTFSPSNIYGPGDHFNSDRSHFIAALVSKMATLNEGGVLELWGTGRPMRQQLYVDDLCQIIPLLLEKHYSAEPLIVAPDENLTIDEMARTLLSHVDKDINIVYNNKLDGQFRKDGSNHKLKELIGDFKFTKFKDGITKTYDWYIENKETT
jgi:GDP-L-fucose synthase